MAHGWGIGNPGVWDTKLGIDHADASAIVGGLAAVVLTINVAVFAARIGRSGDLRGEMDLARWQRKMEILAPLAGVTALVVAGTRFPTEIGLGLVLLAVALVTLAASDVRIAGRLGTLEMEAGVAQILYLESRTALDNFRDSLPDRLQARLPKKLESSETYMAGPIFFTVVLVALKFALSLLTLITLGEAEWQKLYYSHQGIDYLFWTPLLSLGGLVVLCQLFTLKMRRRAQLLAPSRGLVLPLGLIRGGEVFTVGALLAVEGTVNQPSLKLGQCLITLGLCFILYLSLSLGLGLGKSVVLGELARLTEAAEEAKLRAAAAVEELSAEVALRAVLSAEEEASNSANLQRNQGFIRGIFSNLLAR
ncbi:hypothetical protein [Arthrobacter sp. V1I7]|uniref:hypothetical protein n=1 Tax=Arthrobacter sp. V1I7 TaxID=3042274 RepID=UPI0027D7C8DD|nr:hypothetical protein [Arthrobacter sp. V1I7]